MIALRLLSHVVTPAAVLAGAKGKVELVGTYQGRKEGIPEGVQAVPLDLQVPCPGCPHSCTMNHHTHLDVDRDDAGRGCSVEGGASGQA